MKINFLVLLAAASTFGSATFATAQTLLTDNFTVTQAVNLQPNFEIENRQGGTQALSPYSISNQGSNFGIQLGNSGTNVGQPSGDGNYLLLADESGVQNGLALDDALTGGKPLNFTFDLYVAAQFANQTVWNSFSLQFAGSSFVVAGANEFGMLRRVNGGMQFFTNGGAVGELGEGSALSPIMSVTFSDLAGTGSPFAGNGSRVVVSNDGNVVFEYNFDNNNQLASSGLQFGFYGVGGAVSGVDNLTVSAVPEPSTVAILAFGAVFVCLVTRRVRRVS